VKALHTLPPLREGFRDVLGLDISTRQGILSFFDSLDGIPLDPDSGALFETYTGRSYVHRPHGYAQGVLQVGRQAGKSEGAAARLVYGAVGAVLAGRRNRVFVGIAQDHRAGMRALMGHVKRFAERPLVRPLVTKVTADTVEFENGTSVFVLPCRPAAARGLEVDEAVLDELAHFTSTDNIPRDRDVWRALLPTLAMTGGKLIALSSPHAAAGLLFDLHRQHYGNADSDLLFWQSASTVLNPVLSDKFLQHLRDVDAESAAAEIDAEFLRNVSTLFDVAALDACVDVGLTQRPPQKGISYSTFCDAASGSGKDSFTAAVAHMDRDGNAVLDALLIIKPTFSPESAIRQVAALAREYRRADVHGDRYAPGFVLEAFARQRITYRPSDRDRSAIYLDLLPRVNAGQVRLLDNPDLLRELRGLERHRASKKDRVDHRRGGHDDAANAAAGALTLAAGQQARPMQVLDAFSGRLLYTLGGTKASGDPFADLPGEIRHDPAWRHFADKEGIPAALERWRAMRSGTFMDASKQDTFSTRVAGGGGDQ
jgi:hypothetical protein